MVKLSAGNVGEAFALTMARKTSKITQVTSSIDGSPRYRGVEQRQLAWLITTRSQVRVLPPQPCAYRKRPLPGSFCICNLGVHYEYNSTMSLSKDLTDEEFESLSITKKKLYVAELLIKESGAISVSEYAPPVAIIMAGLPGAGKTEFLDGFSNLLKASSLEPFVRIDLDEIVTIYPGYTPKTDAQFRSQGNSAVAKCVDIAKNGRYNMMIDGTFSGTTEASLQNIQRLLDSGYLVRMFFMHDRVETSWNYTKSREVLTLRGIDMAGFNRACKNVVRNLKGAVARFSENSNFELAIVLQKVLRDKDYNVVTNKGMIDEVLEKGYNIDNLKEL